MSATPTPRCTRDPSCIALVALHLSAAEVRGIFDGQPVRRSVWPPQQVQQPGGVVVGLSTGGRVVGEARLVRAVAGDAGGALWLFEDARAYAAPLPHPEAVGSRRALSAMPCVPAPTAERPAPMW